MIKIKYKEIILTVVYMIVLNPIKFKGTANVQMPIFYGLQLAYIFINLSYFARMFGNTYNNRKTIHKMILVFITSFLVSITIPILYSTYDFSYTAIIFSGELTYVIRISFLMILTLKFIKRREILSHIFMRIYANAMGLYVFFSILFLVFPQFRSFWSKIILEYDREIRLGEAAQYVTRYGLTGFSGFKMTVLCTMGIVFILYMLLSKAYREKKEKRHYIFIVMLLLIGNLFYGRSGLLCSVACILLALCYEAIKRKKIIQGIAVLSSIFLLVFLISLLKNYHESFNVWYNWAFEFIVSYFKTGKLGTMASDELFRRMYFVPSLKTFLMGDGYYTQPYTGEYYMRTDAGIMRQMLFYGIIGEIIAYLTPIVGLFGLRKVMKQRKEFFNLKINMLIFLILFQMFFFEIKGEVYYITTVFIAFLFIGYHNCTGLGRYKNREEELDAS